ncbi:MAG TPA: zinc-dependent alcohol dehydrogenase family protein [Kutzneria sp.]|nr:zinc-dependent alcohol dehydrogenase family protein [Kutzneria sp.]
MRAVVYESFGGRPEVREVPDPSPRREGVVIEVRATGLCRSDWHGWQGHDADITELPHVPGHELAGEVRAVGGDVTRWRVGDRVTVPFICACGRCPSCVAGDQQVCSQQTQPGFTHWGSFAELVAIYRADLNLVRLPDDLDFVTAAGLGCRFATAFRSVVAQGRARAGEWVVVHGCGGVGLSAIMIAAAVGAQVVAVDINPAALDLAKQFGATVTLEAHPDVVADIVAATNGGAHLSLDALGHPVTASNSVLSLRRRGRHVQVGLLPSGPTPLPMGRVIGWELEILGSHGMPAHAYPPMMDLVAAGSLRPDLLIARTITLAEAADALAEMDRSTAAGMTMIKP